MTQRLPVKSSVEYEIINTMYCDLKAKRTGLPYMRHIDQGLVILEAMNAPPRTLRAWCVHPVFQLDDFFPPLMEEGAKGARLLQMLSWQTVALAMEYRAVANAFLTKPRRWQPDFPHLSPVAEVNMMLCADKLQNERDARNHLYGKIPHEERRHLEEYFHRWFSVLKIEGPEFMQAQELLEMHDKEHPT